MWLQWQRVLYRNRTTRKSAITVTGCEQSGCTMNGIAFSITRLYPQTLRPSYLRHLTLTLPTWRIRRASNNASRWQMVFNSALKGLKVKILLAKRWVAICPQSEWKKVRVQYIKKKYLFLQKEAQNNKSSLIETNCIAIAMTSVMYRLWASFSFRTRVSHLYDYRPTPYNQQQNIRFSDKKPIFYNTPETWAGRFFNQSVTRCHVNFTTLM